MKKRKTKVAIAGISIMLGAALAFSGCGKETENEVSVPSSETMNSAADMQKNEAKRILALDH